MKTENKKPENPFAFPLVECSDGMTLRDYFAAKALTSMLSKPQENDSRTPLLAATWSYKFADAMLKQREL